MKNITLKMMKFLINFNIFQKFNLKLPESSFETSLILYNNYNNNEI